MEKKQEDAAIVDRKERKRLQNRLNQRARRSRLKEENPDHKAGHRPYEVDRWRLHYVNGEASDTQLAVREKKSEATGKQPAAAQDGKQKPDEISRLLMGPVDRSMCDCISRAMILKAYSSSLSSSISADQLLGLIQFNVLRALVTNKYALTDKAQRYLRDNTDGQLIPFEETEYPGEAIIVPLAKDIPVSLTPTQLQITVKHATWIDLLPFPRMRDNLIRSETQFDHAELANDMVGNLIDLSRFFRPTTIYAKAPQMSSRVQLPGVHGVEPLAPPRGGFIVYGPPHMVESWEVTPEFVWKWGWTLMGCDELIASTNRWRLKRGEAALPMIISRPWHNNSLGAMVGTSA